MQRHFLILSFLLLVIGLSFVAWRWRGGLSLTFSQSVARRRSSTIYYAGLFGVSLPFLFMFFRDWFAPTFHLPELFVVLAGVSMTAQFVCTFFPDNGSWTTLEHRILTGISGVLLLPLLAILVFSSGVPTAGRVLAALSLPIMIWLLVIAIRRQDGHRYALLLQIGYYALFFAPLFYITYS
jgi:hypothetical protein